MQIQTRKGQRGDAEKVSKNSIYTIADIGNGTDNGAAAGTWRGGICRC